MNFEIISPLARKIRPTAVAIFLVLASIASGNALAQSRQPPSPLPTGPCQDPWVSAAVAGVLGRPAYGPPAAMECDIKRYGGGVWSNYDDLYKKVEAAYAGPCSDRWTTAAILNRANRRPNGSGTSGECAMTRSGDGKLRLNGSFDALMANVLTAPAAPPASTPAAPAVTAAPKPAPAAPPATTPAPPAVIAAPKPAPAPITPSPAPQIAKAAPSTAPAPAAPPQGRQPPNPLPTGPCKDPWVSAAVAGVLGRPAYGPPAEMECDIKRYGGGVWSNYDDLYKKVEAAYAAPCSDRWTTAAILNRASRRPNGSGTSGECAMTRSGDGKLRLNGSFDALMANVLTAPAAQPIATPAAPAVTAAPKPVPAPAAPSPAPQIAKAVPAPATTTTPATPATPTQGQQPSNPAPAINAPAATRQAAVIPPTPFSSTPPPPPPAAAAPAAAKAAATPPASSPSTAQVTPSAPTAPAASKSQSLATAVTTLGGGISPMAEMGQASRLFTPADQVILGWNLANGAPNANVQLFAVPINGSGAVQLRGGNSIALSAGRTNPFVMPVQMVPGQYYFEMRPADGETRVSGSVRSAPVEVGQRINLFSKHAPLCLGVATKFGTDGVLRLIECNENVSAGNTLFLGYFPSSGLLTRFGACLEMAGGGGAAPISMKACNPAEPRQRWAIPAADGPVRSQTGACLDIEGGAKGANARIIGYACHSGTNQQWSRNTRAAPVADLSPPPSSGGGADSVSLNTPIVVPAMDRNDIQLMRGKLGETFSMLRDLSSIMVDIANIAEAPDIARSASMLNQFSLAFLGEDQKNLFEQFQQPLTLQPKVASIDIPSVVVAASAPVSIDVHAPSDLVEAPLADELAPSAALDPLLIAAALSALQSDHSSLTAQLRPIDGGVAIPRPGNRNEMYKFLTELRRDTENMRLTKNRARALARLIQTARVLTSFSAGMGTFLTGAALADLAGTTPLMVLKERFRNVDQLLKTPAARAALGQIGITLALMSATQILVQAAAEQHPVNLSAFRATVGQTALQSQNAGTIVASKPNLTLPLTVTIEASNGRSSNLGYDSILASTYGLFRALPVARSLLETSANRAAVFAIVDVAVAKVYSLFQARGDTGFSPFRVGQRTSVFSAPVNSADIINVTLGSPAFATAVIAPDANRAWSIKTHQAGLSLMTITIKDPVVQDAFAWNTAQRTGPTALRNVITAQINVAAEKPAPPGQPRPGAPGSGGNAGGAGGTGGGSGHTGGGQTTSDCALTRNPLICDPRYCERYPHECPVK